MSVQSLVKKLRFMTILVFFPGAIKINMTKKINDSSNSIKKNSSIVLHVQTIEGSTGINHHLYYFLILPIICSNPQVNKYLSTKNVNKTKCGISAL